LYNDGYTIKGVQKLLRETSGRKSAGSGAETNASESQAASASNGDDTGNGSLQISAFKRRELQAVVDELEALKELLIRRKR